MHIFYSYGLFVARFT